MAYWNELPTEILLKIFRAFNLQIGYSNAVFSVCTTWRNAALRIAFQKINYNQKNASKLKQIMLNEIAGCSTKRITIESEDVNKLKDTILHFAIHCPNVTAIECSSGLKRIVWTVLSQVSTRYFKNLDELPRPVDKNEIEAYNACAIMYRHQIKEHYVVGYHPLSLQARFKVLQLQDFSNIQSLTINADMTEARLFDFDQMIDSCPQIVSFTFTAYGTNSMIGLWVCQDYNQTSYKPHRNITNLSLSVLFDAYALQYIIHKFPNLKSGNLSIADFSLNAPKDDEDGKFIETLKHTSVGFLKMIFILDNNGENHIPYLSLGIFNGQFDVRNFNQCSRGDLLDIWCASAKSVTTLKIKESKPFPKNNPMIIITDILSRMCRLTMLEYSSIAYDINFDEGKNIMRLFMPKESITMSPNDSLKTLNLITDQIDEDVYPFLSSYCPNLTNLCIWLKHKMIQKLYTISMPHTCFKLFDFSAKIQGGCLLKIKTSSSQQKAYTLTEKNGLKLLEEGNKVPKSIGLTILLECHSLDLITLCVGDAAIYCHCLKLE